MACAVSRCLSSSRPMSTLLIAQHADGALDPSFLSLVTAAKNLDGEVTALVAGKGCGDVAKEASAVVGVSRVLTADHDAYEGGIAENFSALILHLQAQENFSHIMAPASNFGKNFIPRVAVKLDCAPISDVTAIADADNFERPVYAGNFLADITSSDAVKVMTVRPTAFDKAAAEGGAANVEEAGLPDTPDQGLTTFVKDEVSESDRPDLTSASVVLSGGRAFESGEQFYELLDPIALKLNAALGASRAAVDAGLVPNELQVGQTGKVVAPDLYIAVGISGAIQHVAGMKDSKTIVAINKDGEAPIFQLSDFGLVADLKNALPELTEKL